MRIQIVVFPWNLSLRLCGHPAPMSLISLLLCVVVLAASACDNHPGNGPEKAKNPPAVTVMTVSPRDMPISFEYVGQVQSSRQVNIQARVNGFLEKRVYTEGAIVHEGEPLFLMDQKPFKVQVNQAEAALANQKAAFEVARRELARVKPLAAANALSQKDLDDATGQFQSAAAAVDQAKASLEDAKLSLSYTVIKSPVTGITGEAEQADGTYLSPANSQLTTVAVLSPTYVNFSISENDRLRRRASAEKGLIREPPDKNYIAEIVLADGSVYPHPGKVTFASPSFDPLTGTFLVRATVDNPEGFLRPNQYVRIRVKGAVRPHAITVPQRAVQQGSVGHFVWAVSQDGKAESRPVVIGEYLGNDIFVNEGLRAGDRVIVDGGFGLTPGEPVIIRVEAPNKSASPGAAPEAGRGRNDRRGRD